MIPFTVVGAVGVSFPSLSPLFSMLLLTTFSLSSVCLTLTMGLMGLDTDCDLNTLD